MNCPKCAATMTDPFRGDDVSPWYVCPNCSCMRHRLWVAGWKARGVADADVRDVPRKRLG
jgi:hypothetical protein